MECLIYSPAFKCAKMAWVAGVGSTLSCSAWMISPPTPCVDMLAKRTRSGDVLLGVHAWSRASTIVPEKVIA